MKKKSKYGVVAILCGGKSTRMGFDKALLKWEGTPLLIHTAECLSNVFDEIIFITNDETKLTDPLFSNYRIFEDHYKEKGPLGGICTAFESLEDRKVFIMAGDMLFPNLSLIEKMYPFIEDNQVVLCQHDGKFEPLFAFYRRGCLPIFQKQIEKNETKIRKEFDQFCVHVIETEEHENDFVNLNTMQDVVRWQMHQKEGEI